MIMKDLKNYLGRIMLILGFVGISILNAQDPYIIPKPKSMTVSGGTIELGTGCRIMYGDNSLQASAEALADYVYRVTGASLSVASGSAGGGDIGLTVNSSLAEEEYTLTVSSNVVIEGKDLYGVMRGAATLLQLIQGTKIPKVLIEDNPDPNFRGISIDVARKYHTVDEIRQMIDVCFFYKTAHLGLRMSDDQLFMFSSTTYPKLDMYNGTNNPAYTVAECQAMEAYAKARGVYIYVELEVPGHSLKIRETYPEVFGELAGYAGNIDITSDTCRKACKILIDEMCDIFSSTPYFHLGCDEASGVRHPDFPDFFNEMHDHIRSKGKKILIWEANYINPGNMNKENTHVIAWDYGYYNPQNLLNDGFTVINGGNDPLYNYEHYPWVQHTIKSQERIFNFDKFNFKHVMNSTDITVDPSSNITGALLTWWEGRGIIMVPISRHVVPPFACAMWNRDGEDDFSDFEKRYPSIDTVMEKTLFPAIVTSYDLINDYYKPIHQFSLPSIEVAMSTAVPGGDIRYTNNGTPPLASSTKYNTPITVNNDLLIMAALFKDGERVGNINRILFKKVPQDRTNLTYGKPVTSNRPPFTTLPPRAAVDGAIEIDSYWSAYTPAAEWNSNKAWITIDLEREYDINKITVFAAKVVGEYKETYKIDVSTNNSNWTSVVDNAGNTSGTDGLEHSFNERSVRYIRLTTLGSWQNSNTLMVPEGRYCRIIEIRASGNNTKKPALVFYNGRTIENQEKRPPLRCYNLSGANSYKVMYADNSEFNSAVEKDMTDTAYIPDADLHNGMWYWRVSSNLDFQNYSAVDSFIIDDGITAACPSAQAAKPHVKFLNTRKGVRIFIDGLKGKKAVLNIFDVKGRIIAAMKSSAANNGVMFWNHRNNSGFQVGSGIYILRLKVNNSIYLHRIVISK